MMTHQTHQEPREFSPGHPSEGLRSMTTFARQEAVGEGWTVTLELRSVNSRYCDVHLRLPKAWTALEERIRKILQARLVRGRIECTIQAGGVAESRLGFEPDFALGRSYLDAVNALADNLELDGRMDIATLISVLRDVVHVREEGEDLELVWARTLPVIEQALATAEAMALHEGGNLASDLRARLAQIEEWIGEIEARAADRSREAKEALRERIQRLIEDVAVDEARLAQETALLAERLDITEEIVRARSHVEQFRALLDAAGAVGRRLDFLLQEFFREINTMASKSADVAISHRVVEIKGELEKMREQVQNIV